MSIVAAAAPRPADRDQLARYRIGLVVKRIHGEAFERVLIEFDTQSGSIGNSRQAVFHRDAGTNHGMRKQLMTRGGGPFRVTRYSRAMERESGCDARTNLLQPEGLVGGGGNVRLLKNVARATAAQHESIADVVRDSIEDRRLARMQRNRRADATPQATITFKVVFQNRLFEGRNTWKLFDLAQIRQRPLRIEQRSVEVQANLKAFRQRLR